jgi:hypothetical protein
MPDADAQDLFAIPEVLRRFFLYNLEESDHGYEAA